MASESNILEDARDDMLVLSSLSIPSSGSLNIELTSLKAAAKNNLKIRDAI